MGIEHDGCDGCKYEELSIDVFPCSGCKQSYADKYERKREIVFTEPKLNTIDRDAIRRQTESLSIKAMAQVIDQLAANINRIIAYINEEK